MKKYFTSKPDNLKENWPGAFTGIEGSWFGAATGLPSPLFVVTGWKTNGKENACMQSTAAFSGSYGEYTCILGWVNTEGHMYQSLKETGCCVLNFFSEDFNDKCFDTIKNNGFDTDEITASGLTAEKAESVNAPRIKECFLNIECEYLWEHKLTPNNPSLVVVALKAVGISIDDKYYNEKDKKGWLQWSQD
jgi:flavin reductase (DIM6/NTAB) family NADH-FMN oxidoreductase RutF